MSIIIRNISGDPFGWCEYQVRINDQEIVRFMHSRPNGLADCLREAAKEVAKAEANAKNKGGCCDRHNQEI